MKRVPVYLTLALLAACSNGFTGPSGPSRTETADKSKRTVIDESEYIDFTAPEHNAALYKKADLLLNANGSFRHEAGNSYIKIDRVKGRITASSDLSMNVPGKQFYADYSFDVAAASGDCLYIRYGDKSSAVILTDTRTYRNEESPDLMACIPLYGFGRNRLEVSPVMNGFIGM